MPLRNMSVVEIMVEIDVATDPAHMTKAQALEFMEQISRELEFRIEALKDELREERES